MSVRASIKNTTREFDELRNHEYFNIDGDYTLDPVIEKAKAKVNKKLVINAQNIYNTVGNFFNTKVFGKQNSEEEKIKAENLK